MSACLYFPRDSVMSRIEALVRRHAPLLMKAGGGSLRREIHQPPVTEAEAQRFLALARQGLTGAQIGAEMGRSQPCVAENLRRLGFVSPRRTLAAERRRKAKSLLREGKRPAEIARAIGISLSQACAITRAIRGSE